MHIAYNRLFLRPALFAGLQDQNSIDRFLKTIHHINAYPLSLFSFYVFFYQNDIMMFMVFGNLILFHSKINQEHLFGLLSHNFKYLYLKLHKRYHNIFIWSSGVGHLFFNSLLTQCCVRCCSRKSYHVSMRISLEYISKNRNY